MSTRYLSAWDVAIALEMYIHPPAIREIFEFQRVIAAKLAFEAAQIGIGSDWIDHHPVTILLVIAAVRASEPFYDPRYPPLAIRGNTTAFDQCFWLASELRRQEKQGGPRCPIRDPLAVGYSYPSP